MWSFDAGGDIKATFELMLFVLISQVKVFYSVSIVEDSFPKPHQSLFRLFKTFRCYFEGGSRTMYCYIRSEKLLLVSFVISFV